ncbi:large ribosomal subunit protein mL54-like [Macrobrachium nipponense]|uniref:large ribosomal subunit protein mL54-like n=1 Tax=Macrobrachium nipponense TaxID=159736 RepID=UPI0030C8A1F5
MARPAVISFLVQRSCISLASRPALPVCSYISKRNYAKPLGAPKKGKGKLGPTLEKVKLPVETDPQKLVSYVCGSNPIKENPEDIKLKDDSEYPEWLWSLRIGKAPTLEEMDPETKQYWRRLRTQVMAKNNILKKARRR